MILLAFPRLSPPHLLPLLRRPLGLLLLLLRLLPPPCLLLAPRLLLLFLLQHSTSPNHSIRTTAMNSRTVPHWHVSNPP